MVLARGLDRLHDHRVSYFRSGEGLERIAPDGGHQATFTSKSTQVNILRCVSRSTCAPSPASSEASTI